jgi:hypothetical protein
MNSYSEMLDELYTIEISQHYTSGIPFFTAKTYIDFIINIVLFRNSCDINTEDIVSLCKENFSDDKPMTFADTSWLKNNGRKYYFYNINIYIPIDDINKYTKIYMSYDKILKLLINN